MQDYDTTDTFTDEASTLQADNRTVIITDATYKSFKQDKTLFTIKKDAVEVTDSYDLYLDRVVFKTPQTAGTWTISGTYCELQVVGGCFQWDLDTKHKVNKNTVFGDTWASNVKGIREWVATAKRYWIDDTIFLDNPGVDDELVSQELFVLRLFVDIDNTKSFYGLARISDMKKSDKIDGITNADIKFEGKGLLVWAEWALPSI